LASESWKKPNDEFIGQVGLDRSLFDLETTGEMKTEKRLLVNRGTLESADIAADLIAQGQGIPVRFSRLIAPLRPLHHAKQGCVERFFGSLLEAFPDLERVSDEEVDRALGRMRRKGSDEE